MEQNDANIIPLNHIIEWADKTDEDCISDATNEYGIDAAVALTNLLEREICKSILQETTEELLSKCTDNM